MSDGKEPSQRADRWFQGAAFHQMIPFDIADRHYLLALRSGGNASPVTGLYVPAGASLLVLALTALLAQNMASIVLRKRLVERAVRDGVTVVLATHHPQEWPTGITHELELAGGRVRYVGVARRLRAAA